MKLNHLAQEYPNLVAQWHPTKNGTLTPDQVKINSHKKVWWICEKGHEWKRAVYNRTSGSGCPYCSGRYPIIGETDLATTHPKLAKEWHPTKNTDLTPQDTTYGSHKKAWWLCDKGHEWESIIYSRSKGIGCPYCSNQKILIGFNDLATTHPKIAKEWHPTKNGVLTSQDITSGSHKKVWWLCDKGHEWETTPSHRTRGKGRGCHYCKGRLPIIGETDLATINSKLAKQWHPIKNGVLTPQDVSYNSNKKVWWICDKGHEWQTVINNRVTNKTNCPYCSGRYPIVGETDLATTHPHLEKEWHPIKNKDLTPKDVTSGSNKKVWWICDKGHEWNALIYSRSKGNGCPFCNHLGTSYPEQYLFFYLRKIFENCENRHRIVLGGKSSEVDLFIPEINLVLEYDGFYWHRTKVKRDFEKSKFLKKEYHLIRIREIGLPPIEGDYCIFTKGTPSDLPSILNQVFKFITEKFELTPSTLNSINTIKINPQKDRIEILENFYLREQKNSLFFTHPHLANQWHPTKNGALTPRQVRYGTDKKVWWICDKGHEWDAVVYSRSKGRGCPYCANKKILKGFNDLETSHPILAKQWHPTKNGELTPNQVMASRKQKVWWQCHKGHEWESSINKQSLKKKHCPYCNGKKAIITITDLKTINPRLINEWHPIKNNTLTLQDALSNKSIKVWWQCHKDHEWQATTQNRIKGSNCPYCVNQKVIKGETDLATTHPILAKEWHPTKNYDLTPQDIGAGSGKKVWWQCHKGHEWEAMIVHRSRKSNCPYCSGRYPIVGETDLATTHPHLTKEWHPMKNGELTPKQVKAGTNKKVWWQCEQGHEWQAQIYNRAKGFACPHCNKIKKDSN